MLEKTAFGYQTEDGFKVYWGTTTVPNQPYCPSVLIIVSPNGELLCSSDTTTEAENSIQYWRKTLVPREV